MKEEWIGKIKTEVDGLGVFVRSQGWRDEWTEAGERKRRSCMAKDSGKNRKTLLA
jgi:hypothetical protein